MSKPTEDGPHYVDEQQDADRNSRIMWGLRYQEEYQAALGRMLVRFNEIESMVGQILKVALDKLDKRHLYQVNDYFRGKVDRLELTLCAFPKWPTPDFERLRRINNWRNELAHGYFHQDPNTGEWRTQGVHKKGRTSDTITPDEIDRWTEEVRLSLADVGQLLPWVWFGDEPVELPEGALAVPVPERVR